MIPDYKVVCINEFGEEGITVYYGFSLIKALFYFVKYRKYWASCSIKFNNY